MPERAVSFVCEGVQVLGILHLPDTPQAMREHGVLVIVGGPQYRVGSHRQFVLMARELARRGYPVFRFDCRGMGDSDGEHAGFDNLGADIRAATDVFFGEVAGLRRIAMFGLCDGASAACMFGPRDPRVASLILSNPWVRTEAGAAQVLIKHYYLQRVFQRSFWRKLRTEGLPLRKTLQEIVGTVRKGATRGIAPSDTETKGASFIDEMERGLASFKGDTLLLMSENDLTRQEFDLMCRQSRKWGCLLSDPRVTRADIADADHTFSTVGSLATAADRAVSWLDERTVRRS